jgi:hypothetical protein
MPTDIDFTVVKGHSWKCSCNLPILDLAEVVGVPIAPNNSKIIGAVLIGLELEFISQFLAVTISIFI